MTLQTQRIQTLDQVRRVAEGTEPVDFAFADRASAFDFIRRTLVQFDYSALGKPDKGAVKAYVGRMTGLSRAQLTRLMAQHRSTGRIRTVDEVTQYEHIGTVQAISERFLVPVLEALIDAYPFEIVGFHADNGSEYMGLVILLYRSRSRRGAVGGVRREAARRRPCDASR